MKYDVSIFLLTNDGNSIQYEDYDLAEDNDWSFIMLTNDHLNADFNDDNSILIYRDWIDRTSETATFLNSFSRLKFYEDTQEDGFIRCYWHTPRDFVDVARQFHIPYDDDPEFDVHQTVEQECFVKYVDGYAQSMNFINMLTPQNDETQEEYIPALMLAYHATVRLSQKTIHGYLPAPGQMIYILKNMDRILNMTNIRNNRSFLNQIGERSMIAKWWTSSIAYKSLVWSVFWTYDRHFAFDMGEISAYVFPIYPMP